MSIIANLVSRFKNRKSSSEKNTIIQERDSSMKEESKLTNQEESMQTNDVSSEDYATKVELLNKINTIDIYTRHVNESINILNSTKNPGTFFSRYDFIIERVNQIISITDYCLERGAFLTEEDPRDFLNELQTNKVDLINNFIDAYYKELLLKIQNLKTKKAKVNNANKFYDTLVLKHKNYLEKENIDKINALYDELKEIIGVKNLELL